MQVTPKTTNQNKVVKNKHQAAPHNNNQTTQSKIKHKQPKVKQQAPKQIKRQISKQPTK